MSQKSLIEDVVKGEIQDDAHSLEHYSTDASIFKVKPSLVVSPAHLQDVQNLVRRVAELRQQGQNISLTPRAAGTCMSGGSLTESIMLDMTKHFNGIGAVDMHHKRIGAGAGVFYRDLEKETLKHGLLFPPYTSSKDLCAIGGMIGNNASGEKSLRHGATTDWVRSLHVVLADGNEYEFGPLTRRQLEQKKTLQTHEGYIYREISGLIEANRELLVRSRPQVRKNAAGYDVWRIWNPDRSRFNLAKLFVGAQGTLGIVTGATLNLICAPHSTRMLVVAIDSLSRLAEAVQTILTQHPEGLEVYDKNTYELAKIHMSEDAARAQIAEGKEMVLFAQFAERTKDQTDHYARICQNVLEKKGFEVKYIDDPAENESHWRIRRASFKLLKDHAHGTKKAAPFIEDTIVNIAHYGEFLAALESILADYDMTYTYAGHIGDGSIRLIPLVDMEATHAPEKIFELAKRVYDLVFAFGGSMSVDHNDGLIRTPFLPAMYGEEVCGLFERVKQILDPHGIFNPGKKVYGNLEYSINHVIHSNKPTGVL